MLHPKLPVWLITVLLLTVSLFAGQPSRFHEFAQVADGELSGVSMRTVFLIVNQNLFGNAVVTLHFFDNDGNPLSLTVNGTSTSVYQTSVPAKGGSVKLITPGQGPGLRVGWATLTADVEVGAQVFFEVYSGGNLVTQAAIEPAGPLKSVDLFVDYDTTGDLATAPRTGFAIANLSDSTSVDVGVWLVDENGSDPIWSTWLNLPPRGHTSSYLDEQFPALKKFRGTVRIVSGGSITLSALQAKALIIGTLPPIQRPFYSRFGGE